MFRSAYHYKISGMKIWVVLFAALGSASPLLAQEPTPPLVPQHSQTVLETLVKAGPVMIPMFLLSIFFVALVVVYFLTIRRGAVVSSGYMATADALLRKRDYLGLARCFQSAWRSDRACRAKNARFHNQESTRGFAAGPRNRRDRRNTRRCEFEQPRNLPRRYRDDCATAGFAGTVFGIIRSFGALGADIGSARYVALSRGISEALVNTAAGLAIGIPAMIFYAFFRGRSQKLISEFEAASTHVLALLSLQYGRRAERAPVLIEDEL
jgi:biopolymer transport protein ExbB